MAQSYIDADYPERTSTMKVADTDKSTESVSHHTTSSPIIDQLSLFQCSSHPQHINKTLGDCFLERESYAPGCVKGELVHRSPPALRAAYYNALSQEQVNSNVQQWRLIIHISPSPVLLQCNQLLFIGIKSQDKYTGMC